MEIYNTLIALSPLVVIGLAHRWVSRHGSFFLVVSNLPMTISHELAHFAVALLLGGKPSAVSLWPARNGNHWRLGSVTYQATPLSALPTALAPLVWLIVGGYLLSEKSTLAGDSLLILSSIYLGIYLCVSASIPSLQDMKIVLAHPLSLIIWTILVYVAIYLYGLI